MSRVFDHPNMKNFKCPICKTSADQPVVLVPIPGTERGGIAEAEQVHDECMKLFNKMFVIEKGVAPKPEQRVDYDRQRKV